MASFNFTLDDSSPLVSYSPPGAWTDSPSNDSLLSSYSGSSLHTTTAQGASATITFNGTGISIYGGLRPNYGTYTLTVDGQLVTSGDASSPQPAVQQLLGTASGLSNGPHTAIITSSGAGIDLDFMDVQTELGSAGSQVSMTTIDDSDSKFIYLPSASDWNTTTGTEFMGNTTHFSSAVNAQVSLAFSGSAIAVYGSVAPNHANMEVSLDGQSTAVDGGPGGFASTLHTQTLLYYASDLGEGEHQLLLTSIPVNGNGAFLDIDAVNVYTVSKSGAPDANSSASPTPITASGQEMKQLGMSTKAVVIASLCGAVTFLIILAVLLFFLWKRRQTGRMPPRSPESPVLPMMEAGLFPSPLHAASPPLPPAPAQGFPVSSIRTPPLSIVSNYYKRDSTFTATDGRLSQTPSAFASDVPKIRMPRPPDAAGTLRYSPSLRNSYVSDGISSHSRTSSNASNLPILPQRMPSRALTQFPSNSSLYSNGNRIPVRPAQRPPSLDLAL